MKDYNDGLNNWKHYIDPRYNTITGGERHSAADIGLEARLGLSEVVHLGVHLEGLFFTTGFEHDRHPPDQLPQNRRTDHAVTAVPIGLSVYFKSPNPDWSPYYRLGLGFYPARMRFRTERTRGDTLETRDSKLTGHGWGLNLGLGLEKSIGKGFGWFAEIFYRTAVMTDFRGEQLKIVADVEETREVELIFWDSPFGYKNYQVLPIGITGEPDPELQPRTRKGKADFTGFYLIAGLVWSPW